MFRYTLALLLINTSYQSLGAPTTSNATFSLANVLNTLSSHCENAFLIGQIKSQIKYCSDLSSVHGEKQLRCLMFFDINNQLCSAVSEAKLALNQNYSDKINEEQDVNTLCVGAKEWTFTNITAFPRYKPAVDKVFKHPVACGNICGAEDLMSDDANFFCKYYKWGSDMLKTPVSARGTGTPVNAAPIPRSGVGSDVKPEVSALDNNDFADVQIKNLSKTSGENVPLTVTSAKSDDVPKTEAKPEATSQIVSNNQPSSPAENTDIVENSDLPTNNVEDPLLAPENTQDNKVDKETAVTVPKSEINPDVVQKPETPETAQNKTAEISLKEDVDKEIQQLNNEIERREPVIENPKDKQKKYDPEDYQESDEGKDGLGDIQGGDDGDDTVLEELNNKPDDQKSQVKKIENIVSPYTGESEYYPNTIQDGFSDDDDHFFSFFLTSIIVVVLLYILYHNKNKVSKMFFGLILEGRQSNRRRNSRGHAYKRLDTLEQAMSTNSAAPPSKIIY